MRRSTLTGGFLGVFLVWTLAAPSSPMAPPRVRPQRRPGEAGAGRGHRLPDRHERKRQQRLPARRCTMPPSGLAIGTLHSKLLSLVPLVTTGTMVTMVSTVTLGSVPALPFTIGCGSRPMRDALPSWHRADHGHHDNLAARGAVGHRGITVVTLLSRSLLVTRGCKMARAAAGRRHATRRPRWSGRSPRS